jgi:hypothetical protein
MAGSLPEIARGTKQLDIADRIRSAQRNRNDVIDVIPGGDTFEAGGAFTSLSG